MRHFVVESIVSRACEVGVACVGCFPGASGKVGGSSEDMRLVELPCLGWFSFGPVVRPFGWSYCSYLGLFRACRVVGLWFWLVVRNGPRGDGPFSALVGMWEAC